MISVIIPAYNEEKLIANCLDALVKQNTSRNFEVIIVNNNSTDRTAEIAKSYKDKLDIKVILDSVKGRGHARYTGFKKAAGDFLLSTDADAVVPEDWIEKMISAIETNSKVVAATGPVRVTDLSPKKNSIFNYIQPLSMKIYNSTYKHYWLNGFNFGIKREAYLKSGGFNPDLNVQEDIDLSFKVNKVGKIIFLSDLAVTFSGRRFKNGLIKGLLPYLKTFFAWRWFHKKDVYLDDPR